MLLGAVAGILPTLLAFCVPFWLGRHPPVLDLSHASFVLFPLALGYAIVKYGLFDLELAVRRATGYVSLVALLAGLYAVVVAGVTSVSVAALGRSPGALPGFVAALAVAVAMRPLHDSLRRRIDRLFLGERATSLETLLAFNRNQEFDAERLAQELASTVDASARPSWPSVPRASSKTGCACGSRRRSRASSPGSARTSCARWSTTCAPTSRTCRWRPRRHGWTRASSGRGRPSSTAWSGSTRS